MLSRLILDVNMLEQVCDHRMKSVAIVVSGTLIECFLVLPRKRGSMFLPALVCASVYMCVCLTVTTITKKIVDGFVPNFMGRFLGEKGRPSSCFVTIGRGMWK